MKVPWEGKTGLAKSAVMLAVVLLVSLGLCGANAGLMAAFPEIPYVHGFLIGMAFLEGYAIVFSAAGLFVVGVAGVVMAFVRLLRGNRE